MASDRSEDAEFGNSVAINGDHAFIGAHYESKDANGVDTVSAAGAAYIFKNENDNWNQVQKLVASDRLPFDVFGEKGTISGIYAIAGAPSNSLDSNG